ncbi:MAG TPA: alpha/beta hydrolase-fold protein [Gemmatimonadaceae bacterium]|nr:alpha/beta hydrolase-fold protein [Gemmatimonadaceae bacterium]
MISFSFARFGLVGALACGVAPALVCQGVIRTIEVPAPSLRGNLLGDPAVRAVSVYLPPSYSKAPGRRFPVIYLLHGFAADHRAFIAGAYQNLNVRISMDSLIAARRVREMIVVTPNARTRFDGSFYANSAAAGNWEDFIAHDLVRYVDRHYRTIPAASSRGISGHSMGGYGALHVGMRNPAIFSAIYALSACCLSTEMIGTPNRAAAWRKALSVTDTSQIRAAGFIANILMALSAVYAPNPARPPLFADYPVRIEADTLVTVPAVVSLWVPPLSLVEKHSASLKRVRIGFDAGNRDGFPDIPANARVLHEKLARLGIDHLYEEYDGTHGSRIRERLERVVFPFFSERLSQSR